MGLGQGRQPAGASVAASRALPLRQSAQRLRAIPAVGEAVQTEDAAGARELHEAHTLGVTRLEAHGRPRRHVEPHAERLRAVEAQRAVGLEEVEVRADLDRPIGGIGDGQLDRAPVEVASTFRQPFSFYIAEVFKVVDGQIRQIEAVLATVPYQMESGW